MQDFLSYYQGQGLKFHPLAENKKTPLLSNGEKGADNTEAFIQRYFTNRQVNIGIRTKDLGLVVIDIDTKHGKNGFETLKDMGITLPDTLIVTTPSGGKHYYYINDTQEVIKSTANLFIGIDVRANTGYLVAPPSQIDGVSYTWDNLDMSKGFIEQLAPISEVPEVLYQALIGKGEKSKQKRGKKPLAFALGESTVEEGTRNDLLFRYTSSLQNKGYSDEQIREEVHQYNIGHCTPPLALEEVDTIINSVVTRYKKGFTFKPLSEDDPRLWLRNKIDINTSYILDDNNKTRVVDNKVVESIIKHVPLFMLGGNFYICGYKTKLYLRDERDTLASSLVALHLREIDITANRVKNIVGLLKRRPDINKNYTELNRFSREVVPFKNGLFDPETNRVIPLEASHYLTYQLPHDLDLNLKAPRYFLEWLNSIFEDDKETMTMLLEYLAYALTRLIDNQVFMILTGSGGLGKSVLIRLMVKLVGESNHTALPLQELGDRFNKILLKDTLLVTYGDLTSEALKYTNVIKSVTGGDTINGEHKGMPPISFEVYCKLLFSANAVPNQYDEQSNAFYRRLLIARFNRRGKEIADLEEKLERELPQIIAYLCRLLADLSTRGYKITKSEESIKAVNLLMRDADSVRAFAEDCLVQSSTGRALRSVIYGAYKAYCYGEGYRNPLSARKFYPRLEGLGFRQWKSDGARVFDVFLSVGQE